MQPARTPRRASDAEQQSHALGLGDRRTRAQHVVILAFDLVEHAHAAAAEQVQVDRQPPVHHARQRQALEEQLARLADDSLA